jgi:CheY-like chemotaxis protein
VPVAPGQTSQGPRLAHLRLLAAEDIEVNRFILEDMLTREGAHVTFAVNGRQALERLDELGLGAFDAVLMDVQMPVMGGHEAARRIREFAPALPVIGLTAHALPEEREKCLESGMCEHVTKPIDSEELVAAILRNVRSPGDRYQPLQTSPALAGAPTAVNPPLSASIDLVALASRYSGHRSLVDRILGIAATKYADLPGRLRAAVSTRDLNELRFLAHTIKGISGSLEAHPAYEQAEHTEVLAKAADDQAFDRAARLADTLEELLTALASIPRDAGGEFRLPTDPGA